jgi:poly(hydroxyalkanoate) depolymerase family esterase
MVKASNPFLRGLLRAGKKQRRSVVRIIGTLLAPPKPPAKAKARPRLAIVPTIIAPLEPRLVRTTIARVQAPAPEAAASAGGTWLASHYSGFKDINALRLHRMRYCLYLPDRPPAQTHAGPGLPLIVMLHGCDQTATSFAEGTRMNQLAGIAGYTVLYPQQSVGTHPRRCWKWYDRATQQGGGDVPLIVGIINKVLAAYPIDRSRIYICGISAGAGMANIVALNHPELFAGLGVHSGPIFGAGHSTLGALAVMQHGAGAQVDGAIAEVLDRRSRFSPLPTILIQGEDDPVVRPINQVQLARQAMLVNQLPANSPEQVAVKPGTKRGHPYHVRDVLRGRKVMLRVARVAGLKHAWSGGDERIAFNSGRGPNASKMMLEFFSRHRRTA